MSAEEARDGLGLSEDRVLRRDSDDRHGDTSSDPSRSRIGLRARGRVRSVRATASSRNSTISTCRTACDSVSPQVYNPWRRSRKAWHAGWRVKRFPYLAGQPHHVLIVLEDGNPLLVLVSPDTLEPFEHLVALDGEPARRRRGGRRATCSTSSACAARRPRPERERFRRGGALPPTAGRHQFPLRRRRHPFRGSDRPARSPFDRPLDVIARRSGSRSSTALKLPLVPSTHPRESNRRPISIRCCAICWNSGMSRSISRSGVTLTGEQEFRSFQISGHSALSTTIGSTREARRAGRYAAMAATEPNTNAAVASIAGSTGLRPNNRPEI